MYTCALLKPADNLTTRGEGREGVCIKHVYSTRVWGGAVTVQLMCDIWQRKELRGPQLRSCGSLDSQEGCQFVLVAEVLYIVSVERVGAGNLLVALVTGDVAVTVKFEFEKLCK